MCAERWYEKNPSFVLRERIILLACYRNCKKYTCRRFFIFLGKMWSKIFQKLVFFCLWYIIYDWQRENLYEWPYRYIYLAIDLTKPSRSCESINGTRFSGFKDRGITIDWLSDPIVDAIPSNLGRFLSMNHLGSSLLYIFLASLTINPSCSRAYLVTQKHLDLILVILVILETCKRAPMRTLSSIHEISIYFIESPLTRRKSTGPWFDWRRNRPVVIVFTPVPDGVIVSDIRHRYTRVVSLVFPTMVRDRIATDRPVFALLGKHSSRFRPR